MNPVSFRASRPALLHLLGFLAGAAVAEAQTGTPATGVIHYTMYQTGVPNVLSLEYTYDGDKLLNLSKPVEIASVQIPRGITKDKSGDLVVAGSVGHLYSVDIKTGTVTTQQAQKANPYTIAVTPSETMAWMSNEQGKLFFAPLDPMAEPVASPPVGAEDAIHSLFFRDEYTAYYATNSRAVTDTIYVGILDTRTMETTRWLTTFGNVAGMAFDPFTKDLIICGTRQLIQVDIETQTVKSALNNPHAPFTRSCTIDGEGHLFMNVGDGYLSVIDYSKSKLITDPGNPTTQRLVHRYFGHLAPLTGPGAIKIKPPPMKGFRAAYADGNGDGRIDQAIVELPKPSVIRPTSMSLIDPITRTPRVMDIIGTELIDATHFRVVFPDTQMIFGTTFQTDKYAAILADPAIFDTAPFEVRDSVGPQLLTAESVPPQGSGDRPTLNLSFSEPIRVEPGLTTLPFQIFRDGVDLAPSFRLHAAGSRGGNDWRFEFSSTDFPKGGDSIVVIAGTPLLTDVLTNRSNQVRRVPIIGVAPPVFAVAPSILAPVAEYSIPAGSPAIPLLFAVDETQPLTCINCPPGPAQQAMQTALQAPARPGFQDWLFTVRTLGPFRYDLALYSHVGQFIGRVKGTVDEATLARTAKDKEGVALVRLYWWPVTESGTQARTGAYIARGVLSADPLVIPSPLEPGVTLKLPGKTEKFSLRFGRM